MNSKIYKEYVEILREELVPALGCTEPIAIAYASAKTREVLGCFPDAIRVSCSGNIVKNAKSVVVSTTGNMRGIDTSAVLGAVAGNPDKGLETLSNVTAEDVERTRALLAEGICTVDLLETSFRLHIVLEMRAGDQTALTEIRDTHTNIVRILKNGQRIFYKEGTATRAESATDSTLLHLQDIYTFANEVDMKDVADILSRQIAYNSAIAEEGLNNSYGGQVGATLLRHYGCDDIKVRARAMAAAGSDARMGGCVLPVIINSGSGNQGMAVSLPVIAYAQHLQVSEEKLYRALVLSNLVALLQKRYIGRLSAYCGAVCAGCGSAAAITYLHNGTYEQIAHTITNTLANVSGIVCDGAKGSCAAKIAASVEAGILGHEMSMDGNTFGNGEGLVKETVDQTIAGIGRMAAEGMRTTDIEILKIMLE